MEYVRFAAAIDAARRALLKAPLVHTERWQAIDVAGKPDMATYEVLNHSFAVRLYSDDHHHYVSDIRPDLPWADDHFAERVCGEPLNPPPSEAYWPHAPQGNDRFKQAGIFSHTYPERYWPKYAGTLEGKTEGQNFGIRYPYGDLDDLVYLLAQEPLTRQAYLPVWFPEDTGVAHSKRKPCTLGYHFIMRDDALHVVYHIRSCDFVRHFRNDIYMTVRLLLWVLHQLRNDEPWRRVKPGSFTMHITSLHCFRNDKQLLT